jgi:hypothetical protein
LRELEDGAVKIGNSIGRVRKIAATMHQSHVSVRTIPPPKVVEAKAALSRGDLNTLAAVEHARLPEMKSGTNGSQSAEQKILNAMAALEQLGGKLTKSNVAFFAGYVENWRFDGRIGDLREKGLIEVVGPSEIALTDAGRAVADATQSIRTLSELHQTWTEKLPGAEGDVLKALLSNSRRPASRTAIARVLNRQDNWRFAAVLNQLKGLGIVAIDSAGMVSLTDALYPEGLS